MKKFEFQFSDFQFLYLFGILGLSRFRRKKRRNEINAFRSTSCTIKKSVHLELDEKIRWLVTNKRKFRYIHPLEFSSKEQNISLSDQLQPPA